MPVSTEPQSKIEQSRARREVAATLAIVAGVFGATFIATAITGAKAPARCDRLFDRYIELSLEQADEKIKPWQREDGIARAREKGEGALRECASHLTERQAQCAESATNPDEFERCFP
jgi:hypothetical protein